MNGDKRFSNAKTKKCINKEKTWVKVKTPMMPPDPINKSQAMPPAGQAMPLR
jgi:hypothetical protein